MNMKKMIFSATLLAIAGSAAASDAFPFGPEASFKSVKTRAQVVQEVLQARAQHTLPSSLEVNFPQTVASTTTRTREEVKIEATKAAQHHQFDPDYAG